MDDKDRVELSFHYIKTAAFRTLHVDGAIGGVLPNGNVAVSLWVERLPIPTKVVHEIADNKLGAELDRETRDGLIREVDTCLILQPAVARQIADWLLDKARLAEQLVAKQDQGT